MNHFLAIQHTPHGIELGLFEKSTIVQVATDEKKRASQNIVLLAQQLLQKNGLSFKDVAFFAANQGPGPFTTLRVVISTINGFGFATQKQLIGIDGIDALLQEHKDTNFSVTVALLNAYSGDLYFGIENSAEKKIKKGYENNAAFFAQLNTEFSGQTIRFIGQGATMYAQEIKTIFKERAIIVENAQACSIKQIGTMAWKKWEQKEGLTKQLFPLYLKSMRLKQKKPSHF